MKFETQQAHGNVDESTEVVNDGDYLAYAEMNYGPWTVEYECGRKGGSVLTSRDAKIIVKGPYIGHDDPEGHLELPCTIGVWQDIRDEFGTWDYIERADNAVFEP